MVLPRIVPLGDNRFKLVGGELAEEWAKNVRPGAVPWCVVKVSGNQVVSYGGEVWPCAWPSLFSAYSRDGRVFLTELGCSLFK